MKNINIKQSIVFLAILGIFSVIFYNTKDLFLGAPLSINTATDGATVTDSFLPISGSAKHSSSVEINGRIIGLDKKGKFADGVILSPGYNVVEITEKDRFGKEKHKMLHLVAEQSSSVATSMNVHYQ